MLKERTTGELKLNRDGEMTQSMTDVSGEVIAIRVDYGDTGNDTEIEIETSLGERIRIEPNEKNEIVVRPRITISTPEMAQISSAPPLYERHVTIGVFYIRIKGGNPFSTLNDIEFIMEE